MDREGSEGSGICRVPEVGTGSSGGSEGSEAADEVIGGAGAAWAISLAGGGRSSGGSG